MNTKTVFLLVCLLLPATLLLQAQDNPVPRDSETGKIKFQEVVEEPGTQEELFNRSINWLNKTIPFDNGIHLILLIMISAKRWSNNTSKISNFLNGSLIIF